MLLIPKRNLSLRWVIILNGLTIFLWMGIEDNHTESVVLLGMISALNAIGWWIMGRWGGRQVTRRQALVFGGLLGIALGIGASLLTALLMLLKNARHAHLVPDFTSSQMGDVLALAPIWGLAGGVLGIGLAIIWIGLHRSCTPGLYSDSSE